MPKVTKDYIDKKIDRILDAAFVVAMNKPMHNVSMRDIISESGLSQGGIYRYFSTIDDILIALINRESAYYEVKIDIDRIFSLDIAPEKQVVELFLLWKKAVLDNLVGIGKIYYELCTIYANDQERLMNIISNTKIASEEGYFQEKSLSYVRQKVDEGYFTPKLPMEDIFKFLITSFDGIVRDLILCKYYKMDEIFSTARQLDDTKLVHSLCMSFLLLLGGDEKRM